MKRNIPKKFAKVDKSFINRLYEEQNHGPLTSFSVFPKRLNFYGKDPDEEVVLIVRTHWIAYIPHLFFVFLSLLLPILIIALSINVNILGSSILSLSIFIVGLLLAINILVTTILKWYYTVNILTDERIVVIRMENAFNHSYAEAQLEKIEDVTHTTMGLWGNIFDVGNVQIDTAGHEIDFNLSNLPRPRELQDVINDLLEMKQKGDI